MLGHICIINAPVVFRAIWNMAKGFIDARTQGKVQVRHRSQGRRCSHAGTALAVHHTQALARERRAWCR